MKPLVKRQLDHNTASRAAWNYFAGHRQHVTELLHGGAKREESRLCVLGAGNCNDLVLAALLSSHREIHLVDLDTDALAHGVKHQGLEDSPAIHCSRGTDVTGMLDILSTWSPFTVIETGDLVACIEQPIRRVLPTLPGTFEVVASTCLLSQLVASVVHAVGEPHPRFMELLGAVRLGHLRLLTHLIAPGGIGVLISDIVSSESFPALASIPEEALSGALAREIRAHNFYHGVNPSVLVSLFRSDPVLRLQVAELELLPPWRWNLGPRLYAVCAVKAHKMPSARAFVGCA